MPVEKIEIECVSSEIIDGKNGYKDKYQFSKMLKSKQNKKQKEKVIWKFIVRWILTVSLITVNIITSVR